MNKTKPAIWFPTVRCGTGTDVFTIALVEGLKKRGIRAEITWLPHYAEYLPWLVTKPQKPDWANIIHINSWLHPTFLPDNIPIVANIHLCVQDKALLPYKSLAQKLYHQLWITPIERHNIKQANKVIAVSHYTAKQVAAFFDINNIDVIHNGVDTTIFSPAQNTKTNRPFRILYAGNHSKRKGFNLLPEIMQKLGSKFELYYTGDRNSIPNNLPKNMHALPRLNYPLEMAKAYQNADVLLFPTRLEGFGLVAAEAMACGLPVIASNNSALPEVITHEVTGFLCPQDDANAFVKTIQYLATKPEYLKKIGDSAHVKSRQKFGLNTMVNNYIKIYEEILNKNRY